MKIEKADIIHVLKTYKHTGYDSDFVSSNMISDIKINDNVVILEIYTSNRESEHRKEIKQGLIDFLGSRGLKVQSVFFTEQKPSATALSDNPFDEQKKIQGIENIIAVASGKGGVGKSTVSSNLAITLAKAGFRVGLMDADIYGPSMSMMMGVLNSKPTTPDGKKINPIESHGVKVMSMGFLTDPSQAVIWRGPMLMKAVNQFLNDVLWGNLDYLIVDLPPGTGDVQLTLTQETPLTGAIIVTTPQDVALLDVTRGIKMFEKVNVPVIGIIENMSYYKCSECGHEAHIFGHSGGKKIAKELNSKVLAHIPLDPEIVKASDEGKPIVLNEMFKDYADIYLSLVQKITEEV